MDGPEWCSPALGPSEPPQLDLPAVGGRACVEVSPASWRETTRPMGPARFGGGGLSWPWVRRIMITAIRRNTEIMKAVRQNHALLLLPVMEGATSEQLQRW